MIKLSFAVRRRADIEPAEFHRYWRDEHGPLVRSFQSVLGIRRIDVAPAKGLAITDQTLA